MSDTVRRKRGSYSQAFKRRVVAETLEPDASVAEVARDHGLNANMVFQWRRDPRFGPGANAACFLPVEVLPCASVEAAELSGSPVSGTVEVALVSGHRLILNGGFDADAVLRLAKGLSS